MADPEAGKAESIWKILNSSVDDRSTALWPELGQEKQNRFQKNELDFCNGRWNCELDLFKNVAKEEEVESKTRRVWN